MKWRSRLPRWKRCLIKWPNNFYLYSLSTRWACIACSGYQLPKPWEDYTRVPWPLLFYPNLKRYSHWNSFHHVSNITIILNCVSIAADWCNSEPTGSENWHVPFLRVSTWKKLQAKFNGSFMCIMVGWDYRFLFASIQSWYPGSWVGKNQARSWFHHGTSLFHKKGRTPCVRDFISPTSHTIYFPAELVVSMWTRQTALSESHIYQLVSLSPTKMKDRR
jgi:hypothetical protein